MPPFSSTSKALRSLIANTARSRHFVRPAKHDQVRCSRTIAGISAPLSNAVIDCPRDFNSTLLGSSYSGSSGIQRRGFLGCGDGEEGSVLSKVYEERRVLGYSPEQLFDVVAAVDFYHGFVPWCQRSDILKRYPDGSFDAELEIGFKFLVESYVSHVELKRPKMLKTTASQSGLFDHLINIWEFNPGPVPGSCDLYFLVDFKFQSPLYRQVASMFFKEVVSRLVGSFSERCRLIYGPGVRVLDNSYGQKS
ncbi:Coenzyme Q-binding protein COQ10 homolog, mitochondrial [Linum perenne]